MRLKMALPALAISPTSDITPPNDSGGKRCRTSV